MNEPIPPMLVIASFEMVQDGGRAVTIKGFASSLLRSLFSGRIVVFRNHPMPLYKVERRSLDEVCVPITLASKSDSAKRQVTREFLFGLCNSVKPEPRQWVIVADAGSLALRNIDHLIPPDLAGPYGPPEADFYWAEGGKRKAAGGKLDEASAERQHRYLDASYVASVRSLLLDWVGHPAPPPSDVLIAGQMAAWNICALNPPLFYQNDGTNEECTQQPLAVWGQA